MSCPEWGKTGHRYRRYDGPERSPRCKCGEPEPMTSPSLFDAAASKAARDEGMARADGAIAISRNGRNSPTLRSAFSRR